VLEAKVRHLARLVVQSTRTCVYAGAGLSTAAGIDDYATQNKAACDADKLRSPMCAQPTLSHRVLCGMYRAGRLHRLIQQNHDGLPQKAGMDQKAVNEIHGSLYAPDNPVIPMSGNLREDLLADVHECEAHADLVIAVGTSLAGMNADRVVHTTADRARDGKAIGTVVVGLQRTIADTSATLRIFAPCDIVFGRLAELIDGVVDRVPPPRANGDFYQPEVLLRAGAAEVIDGERYLLHGLRYDAMGRRDLDAAGAGRQLEEHGDVLVPDEVEELLPVPTSSAGPTVRNKWHAKDAQWSSGFSSKQSFENIAFTSPSPTSFRL